jgi:hypothetical protein
MSFSAQYTVTLSGFSNPKYFSPGGQADATGFDLAEYSAYVVSFTGTGVSTVVHEQTMDSTGAAGWFAVAGCPINQTTSAALATSGSTSGVAYLFPAVGVRGRVRVTALTTGDAVAQFNYLAETLSLPQVPSVAPIAAGTNTIGGTFMVGSAASNGPNLVSRLMSAAGSVNSTLVKASAGRVYRITGYNAAAAIRYIKLYSKATAPTVGTDTPFWTFPLLPTAPFNISFDDVGLYLSAGIGYGLTTGVADNDTGALTAADITALHVFYI